MADIDEGRLIQRDSIFRLYSQSKPVTAVAPMILVERGLIDLMDGVDKYLPGFRNPQMIDAQGKLHKLPRAPWIMELLGMTAGLCYPDADPAGQCAARVFEQAHEAIRQGGGIHAVEQVMERHVERFRCEGLGQHPAAAVVQKELHPGDGQLHIPGQVEDHRVAEKGTKSPREKEVEDLSNR